jgi:alpha-glucuronidase
VGRTLRAEDANSARKRDRAGNSRRADRAAPQWKLDASLPEDAYWLKTVVDRGARYTAACSTAPSPCCARSRSASHRRQPRRAQTPYAPVRWVNQWDNLDGSIERGYGGRSIFWEDGHARADLSRVSDYGRLLASLGINGCSINNVNADPRLLTPEMIPKIARIADALRPWGVRVAHLGRFRQPQDSSAASTPSIRSTPRRRVVETKSRRIVRAIPISPAS